MSLVALVSASGAPGVTTTTLGLALIWPRDLRLLELALGGVSSVWSGYLRGEEPLPVDAMQGRIPLGEDADDAGIRSALLSRLDQRARPLDDSAARVIPLGHGGSTLPRPDSRVPDDSTLRADPGVALPSPSSAGQGASREDWKLLATALAGVDSGDTLVDLGRFDASAAQREITRQADRVVLVTQTRLPAIAAVGECSRRIADDLASHGRLGVGSLRICAVGDGRSFRIEEIADLVQLRHVGTIGFDPVSAETLSLGARRGPGWGHSPLITSIRLLRDRILQDLGSPPADANRQRMEKAA